jgi:hypothetical protein
VWDEALHMQTNTHFIVAGDNIFYQSVVVQHSIVLYSLQWCVTQQHTQNPLLCSSCNNGYKNVPQCYVTRTLFVLFCRTVAESFTLRVTWRSRINGLGVFVWHMDESLCEVQQDSIILSCSHCLQTVMWLVSWKFCFQWRWLQFGH